MPADDDLRGSDAIRARPFMIAGAVLLLVLAAVLTTSVWLLRDWHLPQGDPSPEPGAGPRLEAAPAAGLAAYRARKQAELASAGWVDRDAGITHIPIEDAMRLMVERAGAGAPTPAISALRPPVDAGTAPAPPRVGIEPHLGASLPLDDGFRDVQGAPVALRTFFGGAPVVLVFGYYHCANLCSTVMDGVVQALSTVDVPYRIVGVSIDPREDLDSARAKQAAYRRIATTPAAAPSLLTGDAPAIEHLSRSAGFVYRALPDASAFTHGAGFLVATPDGRVSRWLTGVRFDPRDVRLALVEASQGRLGTWRDQFVLLCSHYDPASGRYDFAVMAAVRLLMLAAALGLGTWIWRHRRGRPA